MSYHFDYFVASLKCPVCGKLTEADESTGMQTYIRDNPAVEQLGVGRPLDIDLQQIAEKRVDGYLTVKVPVPGEDIRTLHPWECPFCGSYNWAEIVVRDKAIYSIADVPLNRETLERSHLISTDAEFLAASLASLSSSQIVTQDAVAILREKLVSLR